MASPKPKKPVPASTREALLASAKKLFAKQGYSGTSVQEVVKDAGVNISLVSYHFGGKEGLYRACLDQFGAEKLAAAERLLGEATTLEELRTRLSLFIEEMFRSYMEEPELVQIIHRDVELANPITRSVFENRFLKVFEMLTRLIARSQEGRLLKSDSSPEILSSLLYGMFTHIIRTDLLAKKYFGKSLSDPLYRERVREAILDLFFNGAAFHAPDPSPSPTQGTQTI